ERAKQWYDAQDPTFRKYVDEFARGINDYGKAHPETIAAEDRIGLPVTGREVIGHSLRAVHYMYMASMGRVRNEANAFLRNRPPADEVAANDLEPLTDEEEGGGVAGG